MITWVNKKIINLTYINSKIIKCTESKIFTNGGTNVTELQTRIKAIFDIDQNKDVLMVCNGSMGLNSLISGMNMYYRKKLRWIVQSFTFPCSSQGLLIDSIVYDIDNNMGPNIEKLHDHLNDFDGIVITNCFGCSVNIQLYEKFCKDNNKILLFDNAAASMTYYNGKNHLNYGNGCMVSLHHTKPVGFGEGGFIVFDKIYLESMKKVICFGYTLDNKYEYDKNGSNYKMSEIAAIYIDEYLNNLTKIYNHHTHLVKYFIDKLHENNLNNDIKMFPNYSDYGKSLLANLPIIFNHNIDVKPFHENHIEAKKYYYPLDISCINSYELFNKIICLPFNLDIDEKIIDYYISVLKKIIL